MSKKERINEDGVEEHMHEGAMYWHPITRSHIRSVTPYRDVTCDVNQRLIELGAEHHTHKNDRTNTMYEAVLTYIFRSGSGKSYKEYWGNFDDMFPGTYIIGKTLHIMCNKLGPCIGVGGCNIKKVKEHFDPLGVKVVLKKIGDE